MPRQDVPYGGAICRLKERIAEIWDKLDQKLHSINGVEGDGAGNVEIVSRNDAVVIANDQVGHKIEVSLDNSKLPAAAVSSVNGQTGAVRLDAADIPSDANSNVQLDINWSKTAINDCFDSITTEQDTRQAADAELQININSVQASIPGAAAAAVANDPTVAQLAADVPGKLDKISSGSTLKAYTHTGQAQGETAVVNGTNANSIGLRDGNGRMQAADPAAGATDKTLVTANWVSQTGDSAPNNLIHRNGNETRSGSLTGQYEIPFIAKSPYPEFLQNGIPSTNMQTFIGRILDYNGVETCRLYEKHLSNGIKYVEVYASIYGSDGVLYHPFIRAELTNDNKVVMRGSSRESSNIADYSNNEIVTIGTLKRLGLI